MAHEQKPAPMTEAEKRKSRAFWRDEIKRSEEMTRIALRNLRALDD